MKYTVKQHLDYNLWANQRITEILKPVDDKIIFTEMKSSFPGIGKTLLHLWDAETIWLKRLQGESLGILPSKEFKGNKIDLINGLLKSSETIIDFINSREDEFYTTTISYKTMKGDAYETVVEEILLHLVNHGTYHRGQIITLLRELGVTNLISTDLINFLRKDKK